MHFDTSERAQALEDPRKKRKNITKLGVERKREGEKEKKRKKMKEKERKNEKNKTEIFRKIFFGVPEKKPAKKC